MKNLMRVCTLIIIIFVLLFLILIKPIRTMKTMEVIARDMLMKEPFYLFTHKQERNYKDLKGPVITDMHERVKFTWYKVLEWGDTANISAYVYKNFLHDINLLGLFSKNHKEPPQITANHQWCYVYIGDRNGTSKFKDLLPYKYVDQAIDISRYKFYDRKNVINDSVHFIVKPSRLYFFLTKGYFFLLERNINYSIIDFYEPIATISHRLNNDTTITMSARVIITDSSKVIIIPYEI